MIYLINRYYDPGSGQFLSVDPQVSQTESPYGYAGGNPVTVTDPTGLAPNCGKTALPRHVVATYKAKRYGSGGYRQATLYCGRPGKGGYGYRYLVKHVGTKEYWGDWYTFDKSIYGTLKYPAQITPQGNGNYNHYQIIDQCFIEGNGYAYFYPWPFHVITNIKDGTIINAFSGSRKARVTGYCKPLT
jgi:uncharacterized protein RhaS with RHS repeats